MRRRKGAHRRIVLENANSHPELGMVVPFTPHGLPAIQRFWTLNFDEQCTFGDTAAHFVVAGREVRVVFNSAHMSRDAVGLADRVQALENTVQHGVQPALAKLVQLSEFPAQKDDVPGAASAEYEWRSRVKGISEILDHMTHGFDDLASRLSDYATLLEKVRDLLHLARSMGDRYLREAVLTLHDALSSIYSEDLTDVQLAAIRDALTKLSEPDWDLETVRQLDKALRAVGFETVPSDRFVRSDSEQIPTRSKAAIP